MPELPEVETVRRELNRKLKHKKIKSIKILTSKLISLGPKTVSNLRISRKGKVKKFTEALQGQRVLSIKRRAKLLMFDFSGPFTMLVHLKMTGQFIYEDKKLRKKTGGLYRLFNRVSAPKELLPSKHTHVIFGFTDCSRLYFNDVRKFGYLKIVTDKEIGQVKEFEEYGPEPLLKQYTIKFFLAAFKKSPQRIIKSMLMDPKVVAGIGNIYSDEILFLSGVRPKRKVSSIKNQELRKIYKNIRKVLIKAVKAKGSSVGDFVRTDGSWGTMGKYHFVYGRAGQKCKRCATIINSVKLNGRTGSFCPKCQK